RLDAAITEYQQQFSQAEGSRKEESNRLQSEATTAAKQALSESQAEVAEMLRVSRESIDSTKKNQELSFDHLMSEFEDHGKQMIAALEGFRDKAQELLHVIGSTGMAGEFQKAATSAKRTSWVWQFMSVCSMFGLISFAILAYRSTSNGAIDMASIGT